MAPVGQAWEQRTWVQPWSIRCAQPVHFWATSASSFQLMAPYGQASTRSRRPLAFTGSMITMPSSRL